MIQGSYDSHTLALLSMSQLQSNCMYSLSFLFSRDMHSNNCLPINPYLPALLGPYTGALSQSAILD